MFVQALSLRRREFWEIVGLEVEFEVATIGNLNRPLQRLRVVPKELRHLLRGTHEIIVRGEPHPILILEGLAGLDAEECLMHRGVLPVEIMTIVRGNRRNREVAGEFDQDLVQPLLVRQAVRLNLKVKPIPEYLLKLLRHPPCRRNPTAQGRLRDLPRETTGKRNDPL